MENKIMMPASYNVLSCEEMTMRNYRKRPANDGLDTGLDALSRDMDSSAQNMLRDLGRIVWVTATSATGVGLLVNAAIVLL